MKITRFVSHALCISLLSALPLASAALAAPDKQPVTVKDSMEAVIEHHAGLAALQDNREAVRHEVTRAKSGWGPRVDLRAHVGIGSLGNSSTRALGVNNEFEHFSGASATLTQMLWDGFATRSRVRNAQATLDSMQERLYDNATTLSLDALIAHLNVLRCRDLLDLAKKNVKNHKRILSDTRSRAALGADSMAEVTHTQGRLQRALATQTAAEYALTEAERAYERLTGFAPAEHMEKVRLPYDMYDGPEAIMTQAEHTNPKLAALCDDIRAAQANKELAEAARQPVINLEAGPETYHRGGPANLDTDSMDFRITMDWNVFRSGGDIAEEKAAMARVRQARNQLQDLHDQLSQETENTWNQWLTAQRLAASHREAVRFNQQTRSAYREQFVLGERSLMDILDAESELYNSETELLTAESNIVISAWRIYALTGRLLPVWRVQPWPLYDHVHHREARKLDKQPMPLQDMHHRHNYMLLPELDRDSNPDRLHR